jgi:hypothetical protein
MAGAAAEAAGAGAAPATGWPHSSQKRAAARSAVPQDAHGRGSAVPQLSQNFAVGRFSWRHCGHVTARRL